MKKIICTLLALIALLSLCAPALADGPIGDGAWIGEVISRQVSLYNQPNSSSGYSRKVQNGTAFNILERRDHWFYAEVANDQGGYDYGWIMEYYVIENPTHIVLRNNSGVYALAAPYNNNKRVGTVNNYQRFTVIATTGNYYIVSFREAVCYLPMSADFWVEEDIADMVNGPATQYTVIKSKAPVYGYPTTKYGKFTTYNTGTVVDVLYTVDGFAAIRYENVIAFMALSDLQY